MKVVYNPKHISVTHNNNRGMTKKYLLKRENISNIIENSHEYSLSTDKFKSKRPSEQTVNKPNIPYIINSYSEEKKEAPTMSPLDGTNQNSFNTIGKEKKDSKLLILNQQECFFPTTQNTINNTLTTKVNYITITTNDRSTKGNSNRNLPYETITNTNDLLSPTNSNNVCNSTISSNNPLFSPTPSGKCLICSRVYPSRDIFTTHNCEHKFCIYCLSYYYEYKISNGEINDISQFKCPIIICGFFYTIDELERILSQNITEYFLKGKKGPMKYSIKDINNLRFNRNNEQISSYSQKNVIDVNSNESFYMFTKNKEMNCPLCNGEYLFGRKGLNNFVCLNCLRKFCKYCKKEYKERHLDKASRDRCKIYFKVEDEEFKKAKKKKKKTICSTYLLSVLYMIVSFVFVLLGTCLYIREGIECCLQMRGKRKGFVSILKSILFYCIYILLLLIVVPLIILSFPYFPLIASV